MKKWSKICLRCHFSAHVTSRIGGAKPQALGGKWLLKDRNGLGNPYFVLFELQLLEVWG